MWEVLIKHNPYYEAEESTEWSAKSENRSKDASWDGTGNSKNSEHELEKGKREEIKALGWVWPFFVIDLSEWFRREQLLQISAICAL